MYMSEFYVDFDCDNPRFTHDVQVARWLVKKVATAADQAGACASPAAAALHPEDGAYLCLEQPPPRRSSLAEGAPAEAAALLALSGLAHASSLLARRAAAALAAAVGGGLAPEVAFSEVAGVELVEAGRAHARLLLAAAFARALSLSSAGMLPPVLRVLWRLCALHAVGEMASHAALPLLEVFSLPMYIYIYIYIYICVCVYIYMCVCVCVYVYTHIRYIYSYNWPRRAGLATGGREIERAGRATTLCRVNPVAQLSRKALQRGRNLLSAAVTSSLLSATVKCSSNF